MDDNKDVLELKKRIKKLQEKGFSKFEITDRIREWSTNGLNMLEINEKLDELIKGE